MTHDQQHLSYQVGRDYRARFATLYTAASRGYVDDVIRPRSTRPRLIAGWPPLATKREMNPRPQHGNIPL
jgi:propionyl-CoA carboxylase beta chain